VHPLALGNVHRVHQQIKKLGANLLALHAVEGRNIDKALESMPKMTPKQTYDRMREAIGINEADFDTSTRDVFATRISDFNFFLKKVKPFLRQMKLDLAIQLTNKADVINGFRGFQKVCEFYEDLNLAHYTDMQTNRLLLNNPDNLDLKDKMAHVGANMRNSFVDIYHWV